MDISNLQTVIGSLGFPIVCVIGLAHFIRKAFDSITTQNIKREEKLYEFVAQAEYVNKELTQTNAEFVQILNSYKNDLESIKEDVTEIKENMKG